MRSLLIVLCCLTWLSGCGKQAGPTLQTNFAVSVPSSVQVKHFDWSGVGMDHWYLWVIEPADPAFIQSLVKHARLTRVQPTQSITGLGSTWPAWWPQSTIDALPEHYYRYSTNVYWHVWVDRANNRIYIQWFDT